MPDKVGTLKLYEIYTSTEAGAVTTLNLAAQSANLSVTAPNDPQVDTIRVYRRGGSLPESWFQAGEDFPISSLTLDPAGAVTTARLPPTSGTAVNAAGAGTLVWTNPQRITVADGSYASQVVTGGSGLNTNWLLGSVYNFTIPLYAVMAGFEVRVGGESVFVGGAGCTIAIQLFKDGVPIGTPKTDTDASYPNGLTTYVTYGGAADLWGATLSGMDVSDGTFGAALYIAPTGVGTLGFGIDSIEIKVHYNDLYLITDNTPDDALGKELELDHDVPVTSVNSQTVPLPFIWGPFLNRILGCGDSNRPDAVYWSFSGNADCWAPSAWVTVSNPSEPMMNGCVFNTRCFAFSTERLYEMVSGLDANATFSPFPTPCAHGLIAPWALCTYDAVYFVSKDGIYATTGGAEESLVENWIKPLFPTKDGPGVAVNGYEAVDMTQLNFLRLAVHNDEIYFTYAGAATGTLQTLAWDTRKHRWRGATYTPSVRTFYSEPSTVSSLLLGGSDGTLYQTAVGDDAGQNIVVHIRTGAYDQGMPLNQKEYGNVLFDLDPGGADMAHPITITPYINGEASADAAITVTGTGRMQVPLDLSDVIAFNIEFDISWSRTATINPTLYQFDILWREEPVKVKHFEVRETSHGLSGWQHVRDMNIAIRSDADVTLTLTLDSTTVQTYTIPSTAGARKSIYLPMKSNKFKLLHYSFDSTGQFKLYQIDSGVRAKQWVTLLGYIERKPFGADSTLTSAAFESRMLSGQQ